MNKLTLLTLVVLIAVPLFSYSQDSAEINDTFPMLDEEIMMDEVTTKAVKGISSLKSFELITDVEGQEEEYNSMKVEATFESVQAFEIEIFNQREISIYKESFNTDDLKLAMGFSNLPQGEYFISIKTADGKVVKPIQ